MKYHFLGALCIALLVSCSDHSDEKEKKEAPNNKETAIDLGSNGTANCYIASGANTFYKFNATVMGNGLTTPSSKVVDSDNNTLQEAPAITPVTLAPANVLVLWETGTKGNVINSESVSLSNGIVTFQTADNNINGNAVIAVTNANNEILWSWHIWKVNYNPETDYDTYAKITNNIPVGTFKMMKYNLGATGTANWNGTAANAGDLGLYYQWGRKDPFLGIRGWDEQTNPFILATYANGYSYQVIKNTAIGSNVSESLDYSIKHPEAFINFSSNSAYDWLAASSYAEQRDNLWGNPNTGLTVPNATSGSKSIYDPCPPGWRVPGQDSYLIFAMKSDGTTIPNSSGSYRKGHTFYTQNFESGTTSFWPAAGTLTSNGVRYSTSDGIYWTSSSYGGVFGSNTYYIAAGRLSFGSTNVNTLSFENRHSGAMIRCMKE